MWQNHDPVKGALVMTGPRQSLRGSLGEKSPPPETQMLGITEQGDPSQREQF